MSIVLNIGQEQALLALKEFLKSNKKFFCLSGSAGTGKTTICKFAIENVNGVVVTAPTHKAKKVIANSTGRPAETIQSILGLKPDMSLEDFSETNLLMSFTGNNKMKEYSIVIIDESSMLNSELLSYIKDTASNQNKKVIFMGDSMQLSPIEKSEKGVKGIGLSKVFSDPDIIQFKLEKVERQKEGNPILGLYTKILSKIDSRYDMYTKESEMIGEQGFRFISEHDEWANLLAEKFDSKSKILCWTNSKANSYNRYMRKVKIGDGDLPFQVGEEVVAFSTLRDIDDFKKILLQNSQDYVILSKKSANITERFFKIDIIIKGFWCEIQDLDSEIINCVFILNTYDLNNVKEFVKLQQHYKRIAINSKKEDRSRNWKHYFDFKNQYVVLGDIIINGSKVVDKDIDYNYAITIHKSQGSTYENVFVDEVDMNSNDLAPERNRLKYVAFSRPTKAAYIWTKKN